MHTVFSLAVLIHMFAALAATALGIWLFARRKGTFDHRINGRVWAGLMALTALSSFWIKSSGHFSWIHGLSILVLVMLVQGVRFAMAHNQVRHRAVMQGLFYGGLVVAGAFTLLPQRRLGHMLWSTLGFF